MSSSAELPRLTFAECQLSVDVAFWEELRRRKLVEWRLQEPLVPLRGTLRVNVSGRAFLTPSSVVHVGAASFEATAAADTVELGSDDVVDVAVWGRVRNFNFPEGLNALDARKLLLALVAEHMLAPALADYASTEEEELSWSQIPFCMLSMFTYLDAKSYRFYHKEAFPSIALDSPIHVAASAEGAAAPAAFFSPETAQVIYNHGAELLRRFPERGCTPFIALCAPHARPVFRACTASALHNASGDAASVTVCFFDFSEAAGSLSLFARNIITCIRLAVPSLCALRVCALRSGGCEKSLFLDLAFDPVEAEVAASLKARLCTTAVGELQQVEWKAEFPSLKVSGWRKKKVEGLDLGAFINPVQRADSDARFNLELMKWRVLPSLELTRLADCKALLLGTGTLGCNVARGLLMWGVRHFTLVDRGTVSFSNLARQSLFTFEDAKQSKTKVQAAADALRAIIPAATVRPVPLTIHMPGHRIDEEKRAEVLQEVHQLEELIRGADVVFLLTDSREARWMPTIIAAACSTPVVNVALGFDTYVVMRHGLPSTAASRSNAVGPADSTEAAPAALGCYFCSDVVAPTDSLSFRALDEQCTVTRPAVSSIASAIAVDLVAAIYQHPAGFRCPAYRESAGGATEVGKSRLGVIPQQIRGNVFSHSMHHLCGERNLVCTACADSLLEAYRSGGADFLLRCVNAPPYIEEVCGVKQLKETWEADAKEMVWSSDDDEWADA